MSKKVVRIITTAAVTHLWSTQYHNIQFTTIISPLQKLHEKKNSCESAKVAHFWLCHSEGYSLTKGLSVEIWGVKSSEWPCQSKPGVRLSWQNNGYSPHIACQSLVQMRVTTIYHQSIKIKAGFHGNQEHVPHSEHCRPWPNLMHLFLILYI